MFGQHFRLTSGLTHQFIHCRRFILPTKVYSFSGAPSNCSLFCCLVGSHLEMHSLILDRASSIFSGVPERLSHPANKGPVGSFRVRSKLALFFGVIVKFQNFGGLFLQKSSGILLPKTVF